MHDARRRRDLKIVSRAAEGEAVTQEQHQQTVQQWWQTGGRGDAGAGMDTPLRYDEDSHENR